MTLDTTKGQVKEAAGDLTNDKHLQREGKIDRAAGTVKDALDKVTNKVKGLVGRK
jgi:uncharacterized protein YjbJ (UPF0337 family)